MSADVVNVSERASVQGESRESCVHICRTCLL